MDSEENFEFFSGLRALIAAARPDLDADVMLAALVDIVNAQKALGNVHDPDAVADAFQGALEVAERHKQQTTTSEEQNDD